MRNKYSDPQNQTYQGATSAHLKKPGILDDEQWNLKKVSSVYELVQQSGTLAHDPLYAYSQHFQGHNPHKNLSNPQRPNPSYFPSSYQPHNQITAQPQKTSKNPSNKSYSDTNFISDSQSLQYLSSQEPSFSNKGEFTVCEDFNAELISPVKPLPQSLNNRQQNTEIDWKIASFAPKDIINHCKSISLYDKCMKMYELVQQLKFMKEGFESKLKLQKVNFINQIQQIKKLLFRLNINYEKQMLQFTQNQPRSASKQSSIRQSRNDESVSQNELTELRAYCKRLEQEKAKVEQKHLITLKKYQEEIAIIEQEFEQKLAFERNSRVPVFGQMKEQCSNCMNLQKHVKDINKSLEPYQVEIWKNLLREEQENHSRAMRRLQQKVLSFQDEFQNLEKSKLQAQRQFKQKQKQIVYREAQIEFRMKDIQKRQRDLEMAEALMQKQKEELERKKDKITDYELKVLKEERKQKNQIKEKDMMTSEYFNQSEKRRILGKGSNHERSDSASSKNSRIDINARLKEIQMMRNRSSRVYDENSTSRNSSKDSRKSGYKDYGNSRVSLTGQLIREYGIAPSPSSFSSKEIAKGSSQTIRLSEKLNKLTETLQKQLREID